MSAWAIGLIETQGLVGVLEAADTAAKAADVQLLGVERVGGGLVSVRFRGDTASVQAAVSAARAAAARVSRVVSAHVIPSPAIDVPDRLLDGASSAAAAADGGGATGTPARPEATRVATDTADPGPAPASGDLADLPVARLRQLARRTPGLSLQGRQISRANKEQLLDALRRAGVS